MQIYFTRWTSIVLSFHVSGPVLDPCQKAHATTKTAAAASGRTYPGSEVGQTQGLERGLNLRTNTQQKYGAVPRRTHI